MNGFDEAAFLQDYAKHPDKAFRQLMDGFRDRVFLFCLRVAPGRSEAEDLAQETFIRIWKGLPRFRSESSLSTWIYHIAWNVCASFLERKGHSDEFTPITEEEVEGKEMHFNVSHIDSGIKQFENQQFISTIFKSLPAGQRLTLTLYYLQEQSYEEIAKVTGWPLGTVKATLHRAKEKMRQLAYEELRMTESAA
jgi:RNA polymerase sigma factor (sigma-70 family)